MRVCNSSKIVCPLFFLVFFVHGSQSLSEAQSLSKVASSQTQGLQKPGCFDEGWDCALADEAEDAVQDCGADCDFDSTSIPNADATVGSKRYAPLSCADKGWDCPAPSGGSDLAQLPANPWTFITSQLAQLEAISQSECGTSMAPGGAARFVTWLQSYVPSFVVNRINLSSGRVTIYLANNKLVQLDAPHTCSAPKNAPFWQLVHIHVWETISANGEYRRTVAWDEQGGVQKRWNHVLPLQ